MSWNIYIDRSLSMAYHINPSISSLSSGIDNILSSLGKKQIPYNVYGFGSDIDTNWISGLKNFRDSSTNFGQIIDDMNRNNISGIAGSIIITDGQFNQGAEIETSEINMMKPMHIIGVGDSNPLVDVAIKSIEAPPVIIKGENAELNVSIVSYGNINQRLNITLYSNNKLLGSKILPVIGKGSMDKIRFMINPNQTGEVEYKVQVNAIPDEINILNNKQVVPIQVLKNQYKIAIITGAPNFNTRIIKNILSKNNNFQIEHYYYKDSNYSMPLKKFWDTKYDLILFDNHPIKENALDWKNYLRIFAKKLLSQKTSFAIFMGNDIDEESLALYLNLMELKIKEPLIELGSNYSWDFTQNWSFLFPFQNIKSTNHRSNDYPPLFIDLEIDSVNNNALILAHFSISEVNVPLLTVAEKSPLRYMVWSSPDLNQLFYKTQNNQKDLTDEILKTVFAWLIRTGNDQDFYFRSGKNSYQQGEQVQIIGKAIKDAKATNDGYIHIYHKEKKINTKPLVFDKETGLYTGKFWASQSGKLDYKIELNSENQKLIVSEGNVQVQESQIELNHVYLNEDPLIKLSELSKGSYYNWTNRDSVLSKIDKKSIKEKRQFKLVMRHNYLVFLAILGILTTEWILRRRIGMI